MEAAVAEKETGMTEWNEGRLDDLSNRVDRIDKKVDAGFTQLGSKMDEGFARLDKKMDDGFARIDAKFDVVNERFQRYDERFNSIYQLLFKTSWAMVAGILGLLSVLIGVIATQS